MRILMIAPTPFFADRGCHIRIFEETRALQALGHTVAICTYHNGRDLPGVDTRRIVRVPWYDKLEAGPSNHKYYLDALLLGTAVNAARELRPDVVHGHLHEGAAVGWVVSRLFGAPLVFDLQGSLTGELRAHGYLRGGLKSRVLAWAERAIDRLPEVVVASAGPLAAALADAGHVPRERIRVVRDGVDTDDFRPDVATADLRRELDLGPGRPVVVYLGLLNRYQGVDVLLEAIPEVIASYRDAVFLVMGYPRVEHYRRRAAELGIAARNVRFPGRIDYRQAARYLALGDVAVSPKIAATEANGKLYNYMACGLATVAFDALVNREILGGAGTYAKPGDAGSLAAELKRLLADGELRRRLGQAARTRACAQFSWQHAAAELVRSYEQADATRRPRRRQPR